MLREREALKKDLYLAEMANEVNTDDEKLIAHIIKSKPPLNSPEYYPIGFVDEPEKFGNVAVIPPVSVYLDSEYGSNLFTVRIYYLGFKPNEINSVKIIKPKNKTLKKAEIEKLNAKEIVVSSIPEGFRVRKPIKIITSSYILNKNFIKKNNTKLTWFAFFGFDIKPEQNKKNNDLNSTKK